ncbi:MAG TPA: DUF1194 domain-containing protein [Xanthobacteraceae bacterium]
MGEPEHRLARRLAGPLFALLLGAGVPGPVVAQNQTPPKPSLAPGSVSVALVLAVDTSGSVSMGRFELQKQGYAAAFRNPQVLNAIRSLGTRSITVTMFQWTGPFLHIVVADWALIKDAPSAAAFAGAIDAAPRKLFGGGTSIGGAIDYSRTLLAQSPYKGERRVIDVSGDGSNNSGRPAAMARDEAVADDIGINGLPILTVEPGLDHYYFTNVIGGPGAFMIPAANYDDFAHAILKKLINEIAAEPAPDQVFVKTASQRQPQTRPSLRRNSSASAIFKSGIANTVSR